MATYGYLGVVSGLPSLFSGPIRPRFGSPTAAARCEVALCGDAMRFGAAAGRCGAVRCGGSDATRFGADAVRGEATVATPDDPTSADKNPPTWTPDHERRPRP